MKEKNKVNIIVGVFGGVEIMWLLSGY